MKEPLWYRYDLFFGGEGFPLQLYLLGREGIIMGRGEGRGREGERAYGQGGREREGR